MAKGRQVGAKGKRQSIRDLKADMVRTPCAKPAFITYCYGCNAKITSNKPVEKEIDGEVRKLCRGCGLELEGSDIVRDAAGTYKKKKISEWERGKREAILFCAGLQNYFQ
jgi:hypothetical protein